MVRRRAYGRAAKSLRPFRIRRSGREKSAEAQRAAESTDRRHRESGRTGIRPHGNGSPPAPQSGTKGRRVQRLNAQQRARTERRKAPGRSATSGGIRPDSGGRIVPGLPVRDGRCAAADGCRGAAATPPRAPRAAPRPPGRPQSGPRNTPDRGSCGRYSRSSPPGRDALR